MKCTDFFLGINQTADIIMKIMCVSKACSARKLCAGQGMLGHADTFHWINLAHLEIHVHLAINLKTGI